VGEFISPVPKFVPSCQYNQPVLRQGVEPHQSSQSSEDSPANFRTHVDPRISIGNFPVAFLHSPLKLAEFITSERAITSWIKSICWVFDLWDTFRYRTYRPIHFSNIHPLQGNSQSKYVEILCGILYLQFAPTRSSFHPQTLNSARQNSDWPIPLSISTFHSRTICIISFSNLSSSPRHPAQQNQNPCHSKNSVPKSKGGFNATSAALNVLRSYHYPTPRFP